MGGFRAVFEEILVKNINCLAIVTRELFYVMLVIIIFFFDKKMIAYEVLFNTKTVLVLEANTVLCSNTSTIIFHLSSPNL